MDALRARRSVRTFDDRPLELGQVDALRQAFLDSVPGPFGSRPRFVLVGAKSANLEGGRIGTYGVIRNAPAFVVGALKPGSFAFEDYGYALQGIILSATALGLGTCWLGGFFDRRAAARILDLEEDEVVPAASPVGWPAKERRTVMERVIRASAGSSGRKPFGELFRDGGVDRPLAPDDAGPWGEVLECVRAGPSASNKQPWRIVRTRGTEGLSFHLYLKEDPGYNQILPGIRLQNLDMGIAMRNFEAAARALGLPGAWSRAGADPLNAAPRLIYIAGWIAA